METKIIKGDAVQNRIFTEVKIETAVLREKYGRAPGIAFIGFDCVPLAKYNIPMHLQAAQSMGFRVMSEILPNDAQESEVFAVIDRYNADPGTDAIVLFQPLPEHLVPVRIVNRISPEKEVEGFHPQNMMATMIPDIESARYPMCLPQALVEMFTDAGTRPAPGSEWVYVLDAGFIANTLTRMIVRAAASRVVGPDCPVTFISKDAEDLPGHIRRADVLVIVTKSPEYIQPDWLKPGVIIIDIYSNLLREVPSKADPAKMVPVIRGGMNVAAAEGIASAILPIPGGLMTVVMGILFRNTVQAFRLAMNKPG